MNTEIRCKVYVVTHIDNKTMSLSLAKQVVVYTDLHTAIRNYIQMLEIQKYITKADTSHIVSFDYLRAHIDKHKIHTYGEFNKYDEPVYTWDYVLTEDTIYIPLDIKVSVSDTTTYNK